MKYIVTIDVDEDVLRVGTDNDSDSIASLVESEFGWLGASGVGLVDLIEADNYKEAFLKTDIDDHLSMDGITISKEKRDLICDQIIHDHAIWQSYDETFQEITYSLQNN